MDKSSIAAAIAAEISRAHGGAAVLSAVAAARVAGYSFPVNSRAGSRAAAALGRLGVPVIRLGRRHATRIADLAWALAGASPIDGDPDARTPSKRRAGRPRTHGNALEAGHE